MSIATRRAAKKPLTAAERLERKQERQARHGRNTELDADDLAIARSTVKELYGSAVDGLDIGLLDQGEARGLLEFCRRVRVSTKLNGPVLPLSPGAAEAFAVGALALAEREVKGRPLRPEQRRNVELLAEFARERGRKPSGPELKAIMANKDPGAELSSLRFPSEPSGEVSRGFDLGKLDGKGERSRFEGLIEVACGKEPGAIFEAAREEARLTAQLHALAAQVAAGPRKRRRPSVDPPGMLALPAAVLEDIHKTDGAGVVMTVASLAVLSYVLYVLENRRLEPAAAQFGVVELRHGDTVLAVRRGHSPWITSNPSDRVTSFVEPLEDCRRCGWLKAEPAGEWVEISRGDRLARFYELREEFPS